MKTKEEILKGWLLISDKLNPKDRVDTTIEDLFVLMEIVRKSG